MGRSGRGKGTGPCHAGAREMPRSARILFLIRVLIWPLRAGKVRRSHKAWGILDRLPYGHIRKVRARIPHPCRVRSRVSLHNPSAFLAPDPWPVAATGQGPGAFRVRSNQGPGGYQNELCRPCSRGARKKLGGYWTVFPMVTYEKCALVKCTRAGCGHGFQNPSAFCAPDPWSLHDTGMRRNRGRRRPRV